MAAAMENINSVRTYVTGHSFDRNLGFGTDVVGQTNSKFYNVEVRDFDLLCFYGCLVFASVELGNFSANMI